MSNKELEQVKLEWLQVTNKISKLGSEMNTLVSQRDSLVAKILELTKD